LSRFGWLAGLLSRELNHTQISIGKEPPVKRTILIAFLLAASHPLLVGAGIQTEWTIECAGGTCAGTDRANPPLGPPRDMSLTALAVTAPFLLAMLVAVVGLTWFAVARS
jgi:hypothetical protein